MKFEPALKNGLKVSSAKWRPFHRGLDVLNALKCLHLKACTLLSLCNVMNPTLAEILFKSDANTLNMNLTYG